MAKSRSAKAIILASGQGLTTLATLLIAAALSRLFTKEEYAVYCQTMLVYTMAAPFLMLGFHQAPFYFLPNEEKRPRGVLVENLLLISLGGLLMTLFLLAGGDHLIDIYAQGSIAQTLLILAPYPLLMMPAASLGAVLLARDRASQVAFFNVLSRGSVLVAVVVACLIWPTPAVAVGATVAATAVTTMIGMVLMFRACPEGEWRPEWSGMKRQIWFSVPLGFAGLAGQLSKQLDQFLVMGMCTPEEFAVYFNGAREIPLIGIVTGSVTAVLIVDFTQMYKERRLAEMVSLIHRAMVKCALILIPAMGFLMAMAPEVMRVLFSAKYEGSAEVFRYYLLLLPIRTLTFGAILMAAGYSRHILYQSTLTLVCKVPVTVLLVWLYGPIGAAVATVIVVYFVTIPYLLIVLRKILECSTVRLFPWYDLARVGVASAIPAVVVGLLNHWVLSAYRLPLHDIMTVTLTGTLYVLGVAVLLNGMRLIVISEIYGKALRIVGRR